MAGTTQCSNQKQETVREMLEKRWDSFFSHPQTNKLPKEPETSSVISYGSNTTETSIQRPHITRYGADISKEVLNNILVFDGKQGELSQFSSTIKLYSIMYRVCKVDLVMLCSRDKAHKIISHVVVEDLDVEWLDIKRKLTSDYSSTLSRI